ncbi:hypothetical protein T03_15469 [Trichinella britovi]|uniref:Uncharacterized protein n=1 Tax=Trichinella britovi TaxID=45882 RepID=A0A0V1C9S6_TRIBR|nr:hypothetical protein T03_15469 [Trichinella britovi]
MSGLSSYAAQKWLDHCCKRKGLLAAKAGSLSTFRPTEIILQEFAFLVSLQQYNLSVKPIKSATPLLHSPQARLEQQQKRSATLLTNQPTR